MYEKAKNYFKIFKDREITSLQLLKNLLIDPNVEGPRIIITFKDIFKNFALEFLKNDIKIIELEKYDINNKT